MLYGRWPHYLNTSDRSPNNSHSLDELCVHRIVLQSLRIQQLVLDFFQDKEESFKAAYIFLQCVPIGCSYNTLVQVLVVRKSLGSGSYNLESLAAIVLSILEVCIEVWLVFGNWLPGLLHLQSVELNTGDNAILTRGWRSASRMPY